MKRLPIVALWLVLLAPAAGHAQQGAALIANFNPSAGELSALPFPINLLFSGSTDGTLNIPPPADPADPAGAVIQALNTLDGFSTVAPMVATFSNGANSGTSVGVDPASVVAGRTVRLFQVGLNNPFADPDGERPFAATGVERELEAGVDYAALLSPTDPTGKTLVILPLRPLAPKTGYMAVLTTGIRATDGSPAFPDQTYILARYRGEHSRPLLRDNGESNFANLSTEQAHQLEALQSLVLSQEEAAAEHGLDRGSIVLSWSFITQSTGDVLEAVRTEAAPRAAALRATGLATNRFVPTLPGIADVYVGTLQIPYYLQAPAAPAAGAVILAAFWQGPGNSPLTRYNPVPAVTQTLTIPVLVTIPNAASGRGKPQNGWPVAIFQHGIGQNRTNLLAIADTLASIGFAAVAIDLPLHGITDPGNPLYNAQAERTFNVDLVDNDTLAPPADGLIDPSGVHYINLASLPTSRDNVRQGVADLFQLTATVPTLDSDGNPATADFDAAQLRFIGHSLGAIVGVPYLGLETEVSAATLANGGGGLARLLEGSPTFGPRIRAGLAQAGLAPGTALFDFYFLAAQTVLDPADPINYGRAAADLHPIHLIEVVGRANDPQAPPDQVVPNQVPGAPLSGTEPLARVMGLAAVDSTVQNDDGIRAIVRFTEGAHGSFLSPQAVPEVTVEMQRETAGFAASDGTRLPIENPEVIQPVIVPQ